MQRETGRRTKPVAPKPRRVPRTGEARTDPSKAEPPATNALLQMQRSAGNRAVVGALPAPVVVQRDDLEVAGGGHVTDVDGPGSNERAAVLIVQDRMIALGVLSKADAELDRARMKARVGKIMASDITHTTAAIALCGTPSLSEPAAKRVLKVDLVSGVGTGEANDAGDVDLVLHLLREESQVSKADFDLGEVILKGLGRTVDPAAIPGFIEGLRQLKKGYAAGDPFAGSTRRRRSLLVTEGTAGYQRAVEHNLAGRAAMQKWLTEAAAQTRDPLLRNSAQWCLSGKIKMYCTTLTDDSAARVRAARQPRRFGAYFGYPLGALSESPVPYLRKLRGQTVFDNTNVEIRAPEGGSAPDGAITVQDPVEGGRSEFLDTIRHEVQHLADHHLDTDEGLYKSELNASWVTTEFAGYSPRRRVTALGYHWNQRQLAVFWNLWGAPDLYPYLRANWNSSVPAVRAAWRTMVVGYTKPDTFNPINSVRIETLNDALWNCWTADCEAYDRFIAGHGPPNAKATAVKNAMTALDALDRETIKTNAELRRRADVHLVGKLHDDWAALP